MPRKANAHSVAEVLEATLGSTRQHAAALASTTHSEAWVSRTLHRWEPVVSALTSVKSSDLRAWWQHVVLDTLSDLQERRDAGTLTPLHRRELVWSAGVATDKVLTLSGLPSSIVGVAGEIRVTMPELLDRINRVRGKRVLDVSNSASTDASAGE